MNEILYILTFILSFLLSLYGTPIARNVAHDYKLLDFPDGRLKFQKEPVPYMGGIIIYFAFIAPVGLLFPLSRELLGILLGSTILLVVGLFDDLKALTPGTKFFFQIIATFIVVKSGIHIELAFLPVWCNLVFSFIWILSIINAFNIIDILDGMASSLAIISLVTIFILSLYNTNYLISVLSISLAASLCGFLKYNWEPASIYLGDAGSMVIGLIIGSLVLMGEYTTYNNSAFISAIFIIYIPIFDMVYVMLIRIFKGKSPFFGSRDHFALRLKKMNGLSVAKTVSIITIIQIVISVMVLVTFYTNNIVTSASSIIIVSCSLIFGLYLLRINPEN